MPKVEMLSVALGAILLFLFLGFLGVSDDNTQYLLGAYERNDPDFLANDWFVNATESFHPVFEIYMAWWLRLDQLIAGLFVWYGINLLWLSAALLMLIKYLGLKERLPLATVLAIGMLLVGVQHGWGAYKILTGQALPAYLAYPPALMCIVFLFQRRFLLSAAALVVTFLIHHGLGALLVLCLVGPILVTLPRTRREIIQAGLGAVVVLAAFLPVILGTLDKDAGQASNFMILFYGRSPQHFAMHFTDLKTHAGGLQLFAGLGILAFTIRSREVRLKVLTLAGSIAVLFLLGYLLLEVWYTPVFVRMFAYRALPLLMVLNSCMIASVLLTNSPSRRELGVVALVALSSLAFEFTSVVSLVFLAAAAVLLCARQIDGPAAPRQARTATLVVCGAAALAVVFTKFLYPPVYFPDWPRPADRVLATALDKHTPEDSIIVVPPWLSGLRITSERAIVVNLKNFPIFGPEMAEWADRMRDVSGVDPRRAKQHLQMGKQIWQLYHQGYHARSLKDLVMAAHKYEARFILVSTNSRFHWEAGQIHVPAIWSGNGYALYETRQGVV